MTITTNQTNIVTGLSNITGQWHTGPTRVVIGDPTNPGWNTYDPFTTTTNPTLPAIPAVPPVTVEEIEKRMKEREEAHQKEMDQWQLQLDAAIQLEKDALLEERECADCGELKKHDPSDYICLDCRG